MECAIIYLSTNERIRLEKQLEERLYAVHRLPQYPASLITTCPAELFDQAKYFNDMTYKHRRASAFTPS